MGNRNGCCRLSGNGTDPEDCIITTTETTFVCAKCGHTEFEADEFRAASSNLAKFADMRSKKLTTVSCKQCGHTEH